MSISLGVRYTSIIFIDLSCFRTFPSLFFPSQNTGVAGPHDQLASLCYYIIKIPAGRNSLTARYFGKNILDIVYTSTDYFLKWLNYILLLARAGTASPNLTSTLKKKIRSVPFTVSVDAVVWNACWRKQAVKDRATEALTWDFIQDSFKNVFKKEPFLMY